MISLALLFVSATQEFHLPNGLVSALCWVESSHRVTVVNKHDGHSASHGVCQMKYATAYMLGFRGTEVELRKPEVNVHYAAKYLRHQIDRYDGDIRKGVASYNAGRHIKNARGLTVNRTYVAKVFRAWAENR